MPIMVGVIIGGLAFQCSWKSGGGYVGPVMEPAHENHVTVYRAAAVLIDVFVTARNGPTPARWDRLHAHGRVLAGTSRP